MKTKLVRAKLLTKEEWMALDIDKPNITQTMETFEKIYIKSKDDLPKEEGWYWTLIGFDKNNLPGNLLSYRKFNPEWESAKRDWDIVKWYFRPVTANKTDVPSVNKKKIVRILKKSFLKMDVHCTNTEIKEIVSMIYSEL